MTLEGKAVLVTGAARRVGRAIALALAERGARLAIHYNRSRKEAAELARDIHRSFGVDAMTVKAELSDIRAVERMAKTVASGLGGLHALVNSASVYESNVFGKTTPDDWNRHLDANLRAPFFLCQAAAPHMRRSGGGVIVNIADWAGLRPYAGYIPYCVSKAGLLCLNTALAKALAPEIRVNAVMPGPVLLPPGTTKRQAQAVREATLVKRLGSPEDVARAVVYFFENDFVTGAALPVDGGRLIA
ncbi:MAG: SDR family oxidoreductase [Elusimicrobia bacterium]|nr:SDR family oxidoreductase [Elusimicrobiota bacterium]